MIKQLITQINFYEATEQDNKQTIAKLGKQYQETISNFNGFTDKVFDVFNYEEKNFKHVDNYTTAREEFIKYIKEKQDTFENIKMDIIDDYSSQLHTDNTSEIDFETISDTDSNNINEDMTDIELIDDNEIVDEIEVVDENEASESRHVMRGEAGDQIAPPSTPPGKKMASGSGDTDEGTMPFLDWLDAGRPGARELSLTELQQEAQAAVKEAEERANVAEENEYVKPNSL